MSLEIYGDGTVKKNGNTALSIDNTPQVSFENSVSQPGGFSMRNRIINGDMRIDQRNAGASVTPTTGQYLLDRYVASLSQASKYSVQQNAAAVTPPTGFTNYLGVTSLSSYSIVASDFFSFIQRIEGLNISDLAWGTANAQSVTVSFWVRSSLTGNFGAALQNNALDRSYPFTYTINAVNTWEYKIVTIPGDTTGTWLTSNGVGIQLRFNLGTGSDRTGPAYAWAGANYNAPNSTVSVVGTNGATFYITGVQLEAGNVATPFERRPYGLELSLCQRYYYRTTNLNQTYTGFAIGRAYSQTAGSAILHLPVNMRGAPTLGTSSLASGNFDYGLTNLSLGYDSSYRIVTLTSSTISVSASQSSWQLGAGNVTSLVYLEFSSEL